MAMKESVGSLKTYFIVLALFMMLQNVGLIARSRGNIIIVIMAILGLGLAIAYLYIGIKLKKLLANSLKWITGVILTSMGFLVVGFLLSLLGGVKAAMVFQLFGGLLVTWYLLKKVKRLSTEQQSNHSV
jgi:hypothetical protein